jgi:KUP system potassium uptake protein
MFIMFIWYKAHQLKTKLIEREPLQPFLKVLQQLSNDTTINKYATNLIYLTASNNSKFVEPKIIYSILNRMPKRADVYWFIHINVLDTPYDARYKVETLEKEDVIWITFNLGFRVEPRINYFFRLVVEELVKNNEIDITSRYQSLSGNKVRGDFMFVLLPTFLSRENDLGTFDNFIMRNYYFLKKIDLPETSAYGLDTSNVTIEKTPLVLSPPRKFQLTREV